MAWIIIFENKLVLYFFIISLLIRLINAVIVKAHLEKKQLRMS